MMDNEIHFLFQCAAGSINSRIRFDYLAILCTALSQPSWSGALDLCAVSPLRRGKASNELVEVRRRLFSNSCLYKIHLNLSFSFRLNFSS